MATGWLSLLNHVPWGDVIGNAPKVADGAKKLWATVAGKQSQAPADAAAAAAAASATSAQPPAAGAAGAAGDNGQAAITALQARVATLEAATTGSRGQLLAGTELIQALADQNSQLVKNVEAVRVRLARLVIATSAVALTAVAALALNLFGR